MFNIGWLILAWHIVDFCSSAGMGPYDLIFRGLEQCSKPIIENPFVYNMKYSKLSRNKHSISFDVFAPHGVNDGTTIKIDVALKTANGYKHNFYSAEGPLLTIGKQYAPEVFSNSKVVKFPVPAGNYSIKNEVMNATIISGVTAFFYDSYKLTIKTFWGDKEITSCTVLLLDVVPKKRKH